MAGGEGVVVAARFRLLDALVPPQLARGADVEALRRARLIVVATLIMTASAAFFAWQNYVAWGRVTPQVMVLLLAIPVALSNVAGLWWLGRTTPPAVLLCVETLVVIGFLGFQGGGVRDASQVWLLPLPVMGGFLLGARGGMLCGAAVMALEGVFLRMSQTGHVFRPPVPDAEYFMFLALATTALALAGLAAMFEGSRADAAEAQARSLTQREQAHARLEQLNATVARERDQARAQAVQRESLLQNMSRATASQEAGVAGATTALQHWTQGMHVTAEGVRQLDAAAAVAADSVSRTGRASADVESTVAQLVGLVDGAAASLEAATGRVRLVEQDVGGVARAVDTAAHAMQSVEDGARAVHERATNASELGRVVLEEARRGAAVVGQTLADLQALAQGNAAAATRVRNLAGQVQQIGGTLDMIDDITRQTRMLALNAAIISQQAGEHGRGFSVVAENMRELADRTTERTREVAEVVKALTAEAVATQAAMAADEARALAGSTQGESAQDTLAMVARSLEAVGEELHHIATEGQRQATRARQGVAEVQRLQEGARRAADGAAQEAREVERVGQTGVNMRTMVPRVQDAVAAQMRAGADATQAVERIHNVAKRIQAALEAQQKANETVLGAVKDLGQARQQQVENIRQLHRGQR